MKKKIIGFLLIIMCLIATGCNKNKQNKVEEFKTKEYINIEELSDEFIDQYFNEMNSIQTDEEKENLLIVIAKEKPTNVFGASKVIMAPNNQYMLLYQSNEERDKAYESLKKEKSIISVEKNASCEINGMEFNSWGVESMHLDAILNDIDISITKEVNVAVIDTGLDVDLVNSIYRNRIKNTYNIHNASSDVKDVKGHGTHVTGTILEATPMSVKIIAVKTDSNILHKFWESDLIKALNYITKGKKADVINMSLGGEKLNTKAFKEAIDAAINNNIIIVASSGNLYNDTPNYPASFNNVISVAAYDSKLKKADFSSYYKVDFAAPGVGIKSLMGDDAKLAKDKESDYEVLDGTSMATPHVTAAVAILKSYNKNLSRQDVINLLKRSSIDVSSKGKDKYSGWGYVSFQNVQLCNGVDCDEYGVFKKA